MGIRNEVVRPDAALCDDEMMSNLSTYPTCGVA